MNPDIRSLLDSEGCYFREDSTLVDQALLRINAQPIDVFCEFYRHYEGPFSSDYTGVILSDIVVGPKSSVKGLTMRCRLMHGFGFHHLVLADLCGESITVYDWKSDKVYDVDFEGGVDLLKEGTLKPQWNSFEEFLDFYFLGIRPT